ncbi:hypothetical protein BofuT4_uP021680.1 [Botrytis cinerea T4]|uniref:Uncharacterized protein n=1 Tax=Botryotinia fuckeliana (strain T4) TaxID=999810 RepID=G2YHB5_BOTF4|nr:hypothetical protein BofuT4_uP021680.1 [Botrytis cinerea T4]
MAVQLCAVIDQYLHHERPTQQPTETGNMKTNRNSEPDGLQHETHPHPRNFFLELHQTRRLLLHNSSFPIPSADTGMSSSAE